MKINKVSDKVVQRVIVVTRDDDSLEKLAEYGD